METMSQPVRRIQFGLRTLLEITAVVAFALTLIYVQSDADTSGRYQIQVLGEGHRERLFLLDTATGKVWYRQGYWGENAAWKDYAPPLPK
jgi:hypothetical protein